MVFRLCQCFFAAFILIVLNSVELSAEICFPEHFLFGVSTAAFQVEGAWNVSDKGESMWDRYTHEHPERVFDHTNADVAADSYHQYHEDVNMLKQLGVQYYRFSISWPRVLPTGFSNKISEDGVRYYRRLINLLLRNQIQPLVTMYHYDLPQSLQDLGGWTNPAIADYYVDYARVLFETFGDSVKGWTTFNEPYSFCREGYGGDDAPGDRSSGLEAYMCTHNVLRAHGKTYRLYHDKYSHEQKGFVSITIDMSWLEPASNSTEDIEAAERARQFTFGWIAHPIFSKEGDYPPIMRQRIDEMSLQQRFPRSRLPTFTSEEIDIIRGSYDILGLNCYTAYLVSAGDGKVQQEPSFDNDMDVVISQDDSWPKTNSTWLRVVPWGIRKTLNWIKDTYSNPPVVITENGVSSPPGIKDVQRVSYLNSYLKAVHDAVTEDGCNVRGYTYWSLMDNFEWMRGLSERFGLFEVDYSSAERTRTPRLSARFYGAVVRTRCLPYDWALRYWLNNP